VAADAHRALVRVIDPRRQLTKAVITLTCTPESFMIGPYTVASSAARATRVPRVPSWKAR